MDAILSLDATGQLQALSAGRISAAELLELAVAPLRGGQPASSTPWSPPTSSGPGERARAIDDQRAKGDPLGPLAGLPMTIKDTFDVEGMPASSGLEAFRRGRRPDAVVVAHARHAGAVIWGKTNTPVMAGDFQTYNGLYGTTNNPWDLTRTCGGSSGGAAAALATRITALEIGSDIGGSLRMPAVVLRRLFAQADLGRGLPASATCRRGPARWPSATSTWSARWPARRATCACCSRCWRPAPLAARSHAPPELKALRIGLWLDAAGASRSIRR